VKRAGFPRSRPGTGHRCRQPSSHCTAQTERSRARSTPSSPKRTWLWGTCRLRTWNQRLAVVGSFLAFARRRGWPAGDLTLSLDRRRVKVDRTRVPTLAELERFWAKPAKAATSSGVSFSSPARRGRSPGCCVGRASGPLFVTDLRPGPARAPAAADVCPTTGRMRISYRHVAKLVVAYSGRPTPTARRSSPILAPRATATPHCRPSPATGAAGRWSPTSTSPARLPRRSPPSPTRRTRGSLLTVCGTSFRLADDMHAAVAIDGLAVIPPSLGFGRGAGRSDQARRRPDAVCRLRADATSVGRLVTVCTCCRHIVSVLSAFRSSLFCPSWPCC
jgi:hypothetical protein